MLLLLPLANAADWTLLQDKEVHIACRPSDGGEQCEARATLNTRPELVLAAVDDLAAYPMRYPSVTRVQRHEDGDITLAFDLPWPLADWTPRCTVTRFMDGTTRVISLRADPGAPGTPLFTTWDYRITAATEGTEVVLRWSSALGWPGPIRDRIHRTQGHNFLWGLALATGTTPTVGSPPSSR